MRRQRSLLGKVFFGGGLWFVLCCAGLAAGEGLSDWPQFRGPTGQGTSGDAGLPAKWSAAENVVWKAELPGPGTSSPVVRGPRVYLTCYRGYNVPGGPKGEMQSLQLLLVCLQRDDGKIVWTTEIAPRLPEQETIRDAHGYASSTLAVDGERIYAFFGKSGVFAFDHAGKQVWQADVGLQLNGWGSASSPVLSGDVVIVNASVESQSLVALDKQTGKEAWRVKGIKESWNTPLLAAAPAGQPELVVAVMGNVLGIDPANGAELWSCATDINWYMVPSLVTDGKVVYCIGGRTGGALAVRLGGRGEVTGTHRAWIGKKGSNVSSPLFHEGHVYWANDALGIACCCVAETGELVYEKRLEGAGQIYASPVLADGKIYYVARNGRTFVLAARPEFTLLATNEVESRGMFNASPAIAGNRIFLRSDRFLYCLGETGR